MLFKLLHRAQGSIVEHFLFRYLNYLAHWSGILALHSNTPSPGYLFLFFRTHVSAQGDLCFCFCLHVHCAYLSAHTSVQHRTPHWSPQCTIVPRNPTQCNKLHRTQCNPGHHSETLCTYLVQAQEADVSALGDLRCLPSSCFALTGCTSVPAYGTVSGVCTFQ